MLHTEYFTQIPATLTFLLVALVDCSGCLIALGMKVTYKTVKACIGQSALIRQSIHV
jgi:hypothetical protein